MVFGFCLSYYFFFVIMFPFWRCLFKWFGDTMQGKAEIRCLWPSVRAWSSGPRWIAGCPVGKILHTHTSRAHLTCIFSSHHRTQNTCLHTSCVPLFIFTTLFCLLFVLSFLLPCLILAIWYTRYTTLEKYRCTRCTRTRMMDTHRTRKDALDICLCTFGLWRLGKNRVLLGDTLW
ncbi:hypothetical protein QBC38DRAFT_174376 [Podospora fimiseda]|uniref:Uncharacterized protein n=1 Tax=Podospora fimiseda TaxID=252190 RepID=A0AAN7GZT1_9PEZI|nr:hypothetical protein QBC38DRAFT_174376 [Podospora fimiseda]